MQNIAATIPRMKVGIFMYIKFPSITFILKDASSKIPVSWKHLIKIRFPESIFKIDSLNLFILHQNLSESFLKKIKNRSIFSKNKKKERLFYRL